jgi:hypothetical protein
MELFAVPGGHTAFPEIIGILEGLIPAVTDLVWLGIAGRGLRFLFRPGTTQK